MRDADCDLLTDMTDLALMGFGPALAKLPEFIRLLRRVDEALVLHRPRAVVLIDFPGFHWWVADKAKRRGIPVYYYGVPQLWAWAPWRIRKLKRLVDHVLCKLPFEEIWFRDRGVDAKYVGHPYFDELHQQTLDERFVESLRSDSRPLVTLLPGSRTQEVRATLPDLLATAECLARRIPAIRFACASYNPGQAAMARDRFAAAPHLGIAVHDGRTKELIAAANCCVACSGSVSLELLFHEKPSVILYRVSPLMYGLQHLGRTARYITLVNLLAADSISRRPLERLPPSERDSLPFPEFLSATSQSEAIATHVERWLTQSTVSGATVARLADLKARFAVPGASARAAEYILATLGI